MSSKLIKYLVSLGFGSFIALTSFDAYLAKLNVGRSKKMTFEDFDIDEEEILPDVDEEEEENN